MQFMSLVRRVFISKGGYQGAEVVLSDQGEARSYRERILLYFSNIGIEWHPAVETEELLPFSVW